MIVFRRLSTFSRIAINSLPFFTYFDCLFVYHPIVFVQKSKWLNLLECQKGSLIVNIQIKRKSFAYAAVYVRVSSTIHSFCVVCKRTVESDVFVLKTISNLNCVFACQSVVIPQMKSSCVCRSNNIARKFGQRSSLMNESKNIRTINERDCEERNEKLEYSKHQTLIDNTMISFRFPFSP